MFLSFYLLHIDVHFYLYIHMSQITAMAARSFPNICDGSSEGCLTGYLMADLTIGVSRLVVLRHFW